MNYLIEQLGKIITEAADPESALKKSEKVKTLVKVKNGDPTGLAKTYYVQRINGGDYFLKNVDGTWFYGRIGGQSQCSYETSMAKAKKYFYTLIKRGSL